ncbi:MULTISPECIES: hypothetical protein [Modestobacter]|jgi:hypothetical protein|uniref:Uncharacterized protein n=1 Tax=Modestobacter caceresii TaxID=1522368 RepID=A0A098YCM4_9ACTN|nr:MULTISPECIES: hypothetical protein [Modestobacter]KGH48165.1 hypothetical protein IN07_03675 [Modestobacter caceresii]
MTATTSQAVPPAPATLDQRLARTTAGLCAAHPALAPVVRGVLAPLRDRLHRLHVRCQEADTAAWAAYTADLDRGLGELAVEMDRATQQAGSGPVVDDVLATAAARLELRAWQLRLSASGADDPDAERARALTVAAAGHLAELDAAPGRETAAVLRARLDQELTGLRSLTSRR